MPSAIIRGIRTIADLIGAGAIKLANSLFGQGETKSQVDTSLKRRFPDSLAPSRGGVIRRAEGAQQAAEKFQRQGAVTSRPPAGIPVDPTFRRKYRWTYGADWIDPNTGEEVHRRNHIDSDAWLAPSEAMRRARRRIIGMIVTRGMQIGNYENIVPADANDIRITFTGILRSE